MGNEGSTPDEGGGNGFRPVLEENAIIPHEGLIALPKSQQSPRKGSRQQVGEPSSPFLEDDDHDDDIEENNYDVLISKIHTSGSRGTTSSIDDRPSPIEESSLPKDHRSLRSERRNSLSRSSAHHPRNQSFDGASLRGSLLAAEENERKACRDPLLEAAAAGAAVRKARIQQQRLQQFPTTHSYNTTTGHYHQSDGHGDRFQQEQLQRKRQVIDNEWRVSLRRLATVAASTAKAVAHATAPVLVEAKEVVVSRATDFAYDVQEEWKKKETTNHLPLESGDDDDRSKNSMMIEFANDEETVALYTPDSSPLTTPRTPRSIISERSRSGSGSLGSGDKLFASYLLPTLNSHFQSQKKLQEQEQQKQQRTSLSGLSDPLPPPTTSSSTITDFTNDYSIKWRESVSFSSVLPVNVEEETEDGGDDDDNHNDEELATNLHNTENLTTLTATSLSSPSSSNGSFLKPKTVQVHEDSAITTTTTIPFIAPASTEISDVEDSQQPHSKSCTSIKGDEQKEEQLEDAEHSVISVKNNEEAGQDEMMLQSTKNENRGEKESEDRIDDDTPMAGNSIDNVQIEGSQTDNIVQTKENMLEDGEIGQISSSPMTFALPIAGEDVGMDQKIQSTTNSNLTEDKEATINDGVAFIDTELSVDIGQTEENLVKNGEASRTSSSVMSWLHSPFHSTSVVDAKVETTSLPPLGLDCGNASNSEETIGTPFVESLAIYESSPEVLMHATQAVRNYHANVQTLAECETDEQKEMCRVVCDDTYRVACQLVADHTEKIDDEEVGEFQTRLLDDLRRLREMQKTAHAVENICIPSSETGPPALSLDVNFRSDALDHRQSEQDPEHKHPSKEPPAEDEMPTRKEQSPDDDGEQQDTTDTVIHVDKVDLSGSESSESSNKKIRTPEDNPMDGDSTPLVESLDNSGVYSTLLNNCDGKSSKSGHTLTSVDDVASSGLPKESTPASAGEASPSTANLRIDTASLRQEKDIKAGPLFTGSADSIYITEETAESSSFGHKASKRGTAVVNTLESIREASKIAIEDNPLRDGKAIIKFLVTKLTGYEVEIRNKDPEIVLLDPDRYNHAPIPESVFRQREDAKSVSTSSLSSPPEVDLLDQSLIDIETNLEDDVVSEAYFHFDYTPGRHEIYTPFLKGNEELIDLKTEKSDKGTHRGLVKQLSTESLHESAGSLGTFPKSLDSGVSFSRSPRRTSRRPRRDGNCRRTVKSPARTPNGRSPYATPVDDRSLVNGSNPDLIISDPGGNFVRWDNETEANFPSVPDTEEMTEVLERSNLLDEALMTFSSLEDVQFLREARDTRGTGAAQSVAFLIWRQLVANWKHSELWKAMTSRSCSLPSLEFLDEPKSSNSEDDLSSMSTFAFRVSGTKVGIRNAIVGVGEYCMLRNPAGSGAAPLKQDFLVLARFLCDIGPRTRGNKNGRAVTASSGSTTLQHNLSFLNLNEDNAACEGEGPTITLIQNEARKELDCLRNVVDCVVRFAAQNDISNPDFEISDINASLNVKDYSAIRRKAARKYSGDVLQVKDVLRAQITFPSEGSFVCGLYGLHAFAKLQSSNKTKSISSVPPFEIVRMKNLFHTTKVGTESHAALPTGYRHVIVNIRFDGGLLAEIQFQLAQLFGVMGSEGYSLHQELVSAKDNGIHNGEVDVFVDRVLSDGCHNPVTNHVGEGGSASLAAVTAKGSFKYHETNHSSKHPSNQSCIDIVLGPATAMSGTNASQQDEPHRPSANPFAGGSIAAAAAAAAMNRPKKDPIGGGITAAAAAAASAKSLENLVADLNLASAAAAPAAKACKKHDQEMPNGHAGGDIAAAKNRHTQNSDHVMPNGPTGLGIAAAAAAAAAAKNFHKLSPDQMMPNAHNGGGIAAAAAAAALKKNVASRISVVVESPSQQENDSVSRAISDSARNQQEAPQINDTKPISQIEDTTPLPTGSGGIAAAAAAKNRKTEGGRQSYRISPEGGLLAASEHALNDINHNEGPLLNRSDHDRTSAEPKIQNTVPDSSQSETFGEQKNSIVHKASLSPVLGGIAIAAAASKTATAAVANIQRESRLGIADEGENNQTTFSTSPSPNKATDTSKSSCYTLTELIAETVKAGIAEAIANPRDLPSFFCLYLVVSRLREDVASSVVDESTSINIGPFGASSNTDWSAFSRKLLLRCLAISNQATSIGMVGWLEYGSSNSLDRTLNLPFEVLQQLACSMASNHDWIRAADVLSSLVMRCEQSLPICHPTTLSAMIDLAGALTEAGNSAFANTIVNRVLVMLAAFLADLESLFFAASLSEASFEQDPNTVILMDAGLDVIAMVKAFATAFNAELSRYFLDLLGPEHSMWLLNHSLVADTFSVLANCLSASENRAENYTKSMYVGGGAAGRTNNGNRDSGSSLYYWSLAYTNFEVAFKGWTKIEPLSHPNTACAAYSLARCLRELGRVDDALKILELVASCLERKLDEEEVTKKAQSEESDSNYKTKVTTPQQFPVTSSICFLPPTHRRNSPHRFSPSLFGSSSSTATATTMPKTQHDILIREQTAVLCLWMMAVMTVEQSPDERGRNRALSLLHTASLTIQRSLVHTDSDAETRTALLDLYQRVEEEAIELFEPLQGISLHPSPEVLPDDTTMDDDDAAITTRRAASWAVRTPMRDKRRAWISPRKNRAKFEAYPVGGGGGGGDGIGGGNEMNPLAL